MGGAAVLSVCEGDDVSQDKWDERAWRSREGIRYDLVMLSKKILKFI